MLPVVELRARIVRVRDMAPGQSFIDAEPKRRRLALVSVGHAGDAACVGRRRDRPDRTDHRHRRHLPGPIYAKWADTARSAIGVDVTYNAIGSGAGQDQIISRSVDFGAWL
jgi:hypothetical protein